MAAKTGISWADSTANLWIGCVEVTPACDHCYARELAERYGWTTWGGPRVYCKAGWALARKFQRAANRHVVQGGLVGGVDPELGRRRRVFVNSLSDFFDNHKTVTWRDEAWQLFRECPDVIFMLLTKRPENIRKMLPADWGDGWDNVWIGTTVEDQKRAEHRVPHLLNIPAVMRFLSLEPLLGDVDLRSIRVRDPAGGFLLLDALAGYVRPFDRKEPIGGEVVNRIGWVVAGGESGAKARISNPRWFCRLRDDCAQTSIPFHFKQWGEWLFSGPGLSAIIGGVERRMSIASVRIEWGGATGDKIYSGARLYQFPDGPVMVRAGTKRAGHMLAGREHLDFPQDIRKAA